MGSSGNAKEKYIFRCLCMVPVFALFGVLSMFYSMDDIRSASYSMNDIGQKLLPAGFSSALSGNASAKETTLKATEVLSGLEDVHRRQQEILDKLIKKQAATAAALAESEEARTLLASKFASSQSQGVGSAALAEEVTKFSEVTAPCEASTELKGQVAACFDLRGRCEALQKKIMEVAQLETQGWRDMRIKYHAADSVEFLGGSEASQVLASFNITPAQAKATLTEHADNDVLYRFVAGNVLYGHLWKPSDKNNVESLRKVAQEQEAQYQSLKSLRESLQGEMDVCRGKLKEGCGVQLAGYDWLDDEATAELDKKRGPDSDRSAIGLVAPPEIAILNSRLYPDSSLNVSFILQYFKQPETLMTLVERLYACTEGVLGKGQLPGVTSELIVNVDEPSAVQLWMDAWERTGAGDFLVPIFQHNIHENRGYNRASAVSRGEVLVMLQDDDLPPEDCGWLPDILTAFNSWPRLGLIGAKGSWFTIGAYDVIDRSSPAYFTRVADNDESMLYTDPKTGVNMQFVSVVDLSPMIFRRTAFFDLGGFNEANGMKGEAGIFSDWEIALRAWLRGWQVAQVLIKPDQMFRGGLGQGGGTHIGTQAFIRSRNEGFNGHSLNLLTGERHHNRIFIEVKRMNSMLQIRPGRQKLWD